MLSAGKALGLRNGEARGLPWTGVVFIIPSDARDSGRPFMDSFTARAHQAVRALAIGERTAKLEEGLCLTGWTAELDRLT